MSMTVAQWIVNLAAAYAALGLIFAVFFVTFGVGRIDPSARQVSIGFRLLILPGVAAFWPLLMKRWLGGTSQPPTERNAHREKAPEVKR